MVYWVVAVVVYEVSWNIIVVDVVVVEIKGGVERVVDRVVNGVVLRLIL